ncbi:MAG: hypothetical protein PUC82_05565 [bacterium]|nr:hypothetical protein [bacterium]
MFMGLLEKLQLVFNYAFSSFLEIGLFILTLLFFVLLGLNVKYKRKIVNYLGILTVSIFIVIVFLLNKDYTIYCIDFLLKGLMQYFYFPSTVIYFLMIFLVTIFIIVTIMSNKLTIVKKIVNYLSFAILYFLFFSFIGEVIHSGIDLADKVQLYTNSLILAFIQISNLVFLIWVIYTLFWHLFSYFKKKYD